MKRSYKLAFFAILIILSFLLWGCGDGPGIPGSCGTEDTGIDVRLSNVSHSDPSGDQGDLWQIDLFMSDCEGQPEPWGDDHLNVSFAGIPIYAPLPSNTLFITHYRVTYTPLSPGYPPIDEIQGGAQGSIGIVPEAVIGPFPFLILDFGRKFKLQDVISRGVYPADYPLLYDMTVEWWGQDMYGNDFCVGPLIRVIEIGPYDKC